MEQGWLKYKEQVWRKLPEIKFEATIKDVNGNGIMPTVVVSYFDGRFMGFGYMSKEAFDASGEIGRVVLWSTTDQELQLIGGERNPLVITGWGKADGADFLTVYASP